MTILIILGMVLTVIMALNYQNILSHAGSTDYNNFTVKDREGNTLNSHERINPTTNQSETIYDTQSLDVQLQITNLDQLSQ